MKIGLVSFHAFFKSGGIKNHVLGLQREFQKRGISTKSIFPRRHRSENYGENIALSGTSFPINFGGSQSDLCFNFTPGSVKRFLRKEKFDVLHLHNLGLFSGLQLLRYSQSLKILTFHANIDGSWLMKAFPFSVRFLNKIVQGRVDGIIGVAPLNIRIFDEYTGPKIIIPNGIDIENFCPRPKIGRFLDGKINLLFVGRIEKRKGLIYLLKSYQILSQEFSNLRLIIIGEGNLRAHCQRWAEKHNLKEVYFEGHVADKELPSYFSTADIFVSPAIFGESFGIVLLEAMACGTPVVAFANQGYREFMRGKIGEEFLAPTKDYRVLAEKIAVLIRDKSLREEVSKKGIVEAQQYSWANIADQVLNFYQLCQNNKG